MGARTALVTGGSRGIGAATAVRLARDGWDVVLTYRERADAAATVVRACEALGRQARALPCDVADPDQVEALFARLDDEVGPLDGVVNNAGVVPVAGPARTWTVERVRSLVAVNVVGALLVAARSVPRLRAGGVLVNVSSRAAVLGGAGEYVDYAATKAALDALTVGLAAEVAGDGVRVVGVRPGLVDTEIHAPGRLARLGTTPPLGRPGTAEEVAATVCWLMSPEASYVTGTTLDVSGGR